MLRELSCFGIGAAVGCVGTYMLLKNRYEAMVKEADEAAMEFIKKRSGEDNEQNHGSIKPEVKHSEEVTNYNKIRESIIDDGNKVEDNKPYQISEQEFVEDDEEFDKVSLEYYTEGEGLYEGSEYIPNVEDVVGEDNLSVLHGADLDIMYVRNEDLKTDYEVSKIVGKFTDVN